MSFSDDDEISVSCLVIGDPHFKYTNLDEMWEFSKKTIDLAEKYRPTFIVILGDTLDTHEIIRIEPRDAAEEWIDKLTNISEVYLLIGNHDMANPKEFLTKKHAFSSLKRWQSSKKGKLHVVDYPIYKEIGNKSFVFCPFVPKGMFQDALDKLFKEGYTWDLADCIFAHQEFKGGHQGAYEITDGDDWDENYPSVINGHFHNEETIGKNIFIPGTPIQHSFGDTPNKKVWFITFDDEDNEEDEEKEIPFNIKKIDLGIKTKKIVTINIEDIHNFKYLSQTKKHIIKLKIKGAEEQISVFKSTELYKKLQKVDSLVLEFVNISESVDVEENKFNCQMMNSACRDQVSYLSMLQKVVDKKTDPVKEIYKEIVGHVEEETIYEVVFESDEE